MTGCVDYIIEFALNILQKVGLVVEKERMQIWKCMVLHLFAGYYVSQCYQTVLGSQQPNAALRSLEAIFGRINVT